MKKIKVIMTILLSLMLISGCSQEIQHEDNNVQGEHVKLTV